jgi:hypothetical protein
MILGFTGTSKGMNSPQIALFKSVLEIYDWSEFHDGDCIGADEDAHMIVFIDHPPIKTVSHPPINDSKRAWCSADEVREEKDYLVRDKDIVDESDVLFAAPLSNQEILRSGTWATIRYAQKKGIPVIIAPR